MDNVIDPFQQPVPVAGDSQVQFLDDGALQKGRIDVMEMDIHQSQFVALLQMIRQNSSYITACAGDHDCGHCRNTPLFFLQLLS